MRITFNHIKAVFHTLHSASSMADKLRSSGVKKNKFILWADLVYSRLISGYDFDDYCTYRFWEKNKMERSEYLSFRENSRIALKLTPKKTFDLFLDKSKWNTRFSQYINRNWTSINGLDRATVMNFIKENEVVILKPLKDYGGVGIRKITIADPNIEESVDYILAQEDMMMEECMENHPDLKRLAPSSLNTIRIVTVLDMKGNVHIPAALLRMGSGTSLTDNYHTGGMACPIDLRTGKLTGTATGEFNTPYLEHPYTKIQFQGYPIPRFQEIMEMARKVALEEPGARYVGWDFVVTPKGIEILEGNIPPGEHITQISSGPLRTRLLKWMNG